MRLGMESVPRIVPRGLTKAREKACAIAGNEMALNAGWGEEKLRPELEGLRELDFDLPLTGFSEEGTKDLLGPDGGPDVPDGADDAPEPESEAVSKHGGAWILGGAQAPLDGIRPQARGRHRPEMGEADGQEGAKGG